MADENTPFKAADLIGPAGTGSQGALLVDTLRAGFPAELESAMQRGENLELQKELFRSDDRQKNMKRLGKLAGRKVVDARVRGGADEDGNLIDADEAFVCYVTYDENGEPLKGALSYNDFTSNKSGDDLESHVSQSEALAASPAARDHDQARAKAEAAAEQSGQSDEPQEVNPLTANQGDLVKYMEANPGQVEAIKAAEQTRSRPRKSIVEFEAESEGSGSGSGSGSGEGSSGGSGDEDDGELTGDALDKAAEELDIEGRSSMSADQKRDAVSKARAARAAQS